MDLYEVWCAILYLLKSGCQWRMLPSDFPKWRTVHSYFSQWSEPDQKGISVLERALKKSGWRGPYPTGAQLKTRQSIVFTRSAGGKHVMAGQVRP